MSSAGSTRRGRHGGEEGEAPAPTRSSSRLRKKADEAAPEAEDVVTELDLIDRHLTKKESRRSAQQKKRPAPEKLEKKEKKKAIGVSEVAAGNVSDECAEALDEEELSADQSSEQEAEIEAPKMKRVAQSSRPGRDGDADDCCFVGPPIPESAARTSWPERYKKSGSSLFKRADEDEEVRAKYHYKQARVDGVMYELGDDVYVKAGDDEADYIGRIREFFEGIDQKLYFCCQWFFRAVDTVIKKDAATLTKHDPRRVFLSEEKNDNVLDCIVSKIKIARVMPNIDLDAKLREIPECDLYFDMSYSVLYSTFANLPQEPTNGEVCNEVEASPPAEKNVATLLDLYSGCGGMSTGLCLGAALSGLDLQTRWAVDLNEFACESLKLNHPQTEVRNEKADDFLALLKEWEKLCKEHVFDNANMDLDGSTDSDSDEEDNSSTLQKGVFEVEKLLGICYGKTENLNKQGLKFKVRWRGYDSSEDTWEPIEGLCDCPEKIKEFVRTGYRNNILPLPGNVDVICGGPPCQGISGFNRFRDREDPLRDEKNRQMVIFPDIVEYLKPKYVLMENVVDILKFADGYLGRYALGRLVAMNYQARLGMMVAGCYGLPQFRMRVFLWGALPSQVLPQFPLPTHDVVVRGGVPNEFTHNIVAYDETQTRNLKKALVLGDALSDMPPVDNYEARDEMPYIDPPKTEFQRYIRLSRREMLDYSAGEVTFEEGKLFDHQPLKLNEDDYERVCRIPKKKGANFRDLPGVKVGPNNVVEWDTTIERVYLKSGKPLVPDYAMSFINGRSPKPFGRLWWDETVPTVVTRAEPHNQIILHPVQDRVLTVRENARLQGFPDYYKLVGPRKQKYIQVGNAVAVPVGRALGFALGQAFQGAVSTDLHTFILPDIFCNIGSVTSPLPYGDSEIE